MPLSLSPATLSIAGVLLLTIVAVESGGWYMLQFFRGRTATPFQIAFSRAGHAHAGVLVILSLVVLLAGFFLAAAGRGRTSPNRFIWLVYAGAASLAAGVIALGLGLLLR